MSDESFRWGRVDLPDDRVVCREVGPLALWLQHTHGEVRIAQHRPEDIDAPPRPGPDGPTDPEEWARYVPPGAGDAVELSAVLPAVPVLAHPQSPFALGPGAEAAIYVRIPLWVRVGVPDRPGLPPLVEIPVRILSNTWAGGFTEGFLCHWLDISVHRRSDHLFVGPHLAVLPVTIRNEHTEALHIERIALRLQHHGLWRDGERLWCDPLKLTYMGPEAYTRIGPAGAAPREAPDARRLHEPRDPAPRRLIGRTFAALQSVPGLDVPMG